MSVRNQLDAIAAHRILILDGAMGSVIQTHKFLEADFRGKRFANHSRSVAGCYDLLCLTKPAVISTIHEAYLKAGADIIETCSFNSTSISLADYGIAGLAYEISEASAILARAAADKFSTDDKPRFVAGSMGPTAKSLSLSAYMDDGISREELEAAYYDNARGLLDGGADILIIETVFDVLNAEAALSAIARLQEERQASNGSIDADIPVMVSATVSNKAGRLISGHDLEAFCASVIPARPWALGLNCSLGADTLLPHLRDLAAIVDRRGFSCLISAHPNAGLPNEFGLYDETPEIMAAAVEKYFQAGLVNIIGGCCGTTPEHIAAIAAKAAAAAPRACYTGSPGTGAINPDIDYARELTLVGERTNVSGSREFLTRIREKNYTKARALVREMLAQGAAVINVGMDDALLDAEKEMKNFLQAILPDPDIARFPIMIDSSYWNVIEAGLACVPGKALVNSISLKDGEGEFLRRMEIIRRYNAAAVIMLIDENGQATVFERKIAIARRVYDLLRNMPGGIPPGGFPPGDIIFDPIVLTVATGISDHDSYALDFIRACTWIRENCPGVRIIGGISNLSFSFKGNRVVREAMHSVFLKYAAAAGLNMAIVNPGAMISYNDIDPELRTVTEDVILNRGHSAAERLLDFAARIAAGEYSAASADTAEKIVHTVQSNWRAAGAKERVVYAVVNGLDGYIGADVMELKENEGVTALSIIEGPLMEGIREVGRLFGEARMYLPQVLHSAMVMKKAVTVLEPFLTKEKNSGTNAGKGQGGAKKIVLATVKGDVHDIGKDIVGVVLGCSGFEIIDLGVMAPAEIIVKTAIRQKAAAIGLSGLISPSLDEMIHVAAEMEKAKWPGGIRIPLLIGGAAANQVHTALRIAPVYSGPVVYVPDAAQAVPMVRTLLSNKDSPGFLDKIGDNYRELAVNYAIGSREQISLEKARANRVPACSFTLPDPALSGSALTGFMDLNNYPIDKVIPHIDWHSFLQTWELAENTYPNFFRAKSEIKSIRNKLLAETQLILRRIQTEGLLELKGVAGFFPAAADGDDLVLFESDTPDGSGKPDVAHRKEMARFCFLRNQEKKQSGAYNPCLADFFPSLQNAAGGGIQPVGGLHPGRSIQPSSGVQPCSDMHPNSGQSIGNIGLFALSAGFGQYEAVKAFHDQQDDYSAILLVSIANTLVEAFAAELHSRLRPEKFPGIRPAFGYPISPDHEDKRLAFKLLDAEKHCGLTLTETAMMVPAASVCGMFIFHPAAYYFNIGHVGEDQLVDWAQRKNISLEEARRRLGAFAY
ncbi:MAG: methionine synthase [Treponema sp.]|nr:methionine synthase [Treponema sp.]